MKSHRHQQLDQLFAVGDEALRQHGMDTRLDGDVVCGDCQRLCQWNEIRITQQSAQLLCSLCNDRFVTASRKRRILAFFTSPIFFILLTLMVSLILYFSGIGYTSIATLRRQDHNKPAYQQQLGMYYLKRAERCLMRIKIYEMFAEKDQITTWAKLAEISFHAADESWNDASVRPFLEFGGALMEAAGGNPGTAYIRMLPLESAIPDENRWAYYFQRGKVALQSGALDKCRQDWDLILHEMVDNEPDMIESAISAMGKIAAAYALEKNAESWRNKVIQACGFELSANQIIATIIKEYRKYHVYSPDAQLLEARNKNIARLSDSSPRSTDQLVTPLDDETNEKPTLVDPIRE